MDINKIREIIAIFDSSKANFLELEDDGFYLKLHEKQYKVYQNNENSPANIPVSMPQPTIEATMKESSDDEKNFHTIKSPMVGTFYRAPSPDTEPFVEIGQKVNSGNTLCIIEAMKLMNEIDSDIKGEIIKILVENSDPVEYNQPLFLIKPE